LLFGYLDSGLTTLSVKNAVGATVGMALALDSGGVIWSRSKDEFPYITGVVFRICLS
jgi:hypothetical protein